MIEACSKSAFLSTVLTLYLNLGLGRQCGPRSKATWKEAHWRGLIGEGAHWKGGLVGGGLIGGEPSVEVV